ncbi:MAG: phasin family protein [Pseudomonadota bacterium]|jgi:poly(hydroxyalkanoate) granule-associated protein
MGTSKPKLKKKREVSEHAADKAKGLLESAQQIWMAGLGAFGRAQEEGGKLFEGLVREGMSLEQKTRRFATGRVDVARDAVENTVAQVKERATDTWDRLEKVFEDRVSRALSKLGVPGRDEMQALIERVEDLNRAVRALGGAPAKRATKAAGRAPKRPAKKAARRAAKASTRLPADQSGDTAG